MRLNTSFNTEITFRTNIFCHNRWNSKLHLSNDASKSCRSFQYVYHSRQKVVFTVSGPSGRGNFVALNVFCSVGRFIFIEDSLSQYKIAFDKRLTRIKVKKIWFILAKPSTWISQCIERTKSLQIWPHRTGCANAPVKDKMSKSLFEIW